MISSNICIDLQYKLGRSLDPIEVDQILALQDIYGKTNVLSALKKCQSDDLKSVAHYLAASSGLPDKLPSCLSLIFSPQKTTPDVNPVLVGMKEIFSDLVNADQYTELTKDTHGSSVFQRWQNITGEPASNAERSLIEKALDKYGLWHVNRVVEVLSGGGLKSESEKINILTSWFKALDEKSYGDIENLVHQAGHKDDSLTFGVARPGFPLLAEAYFKMLYNREIEVTDILKVLELIKPFSSEIFIDALDKIYPDEFSISLLEERWLMVIHPRQYKELMYRREKSIYYCEKCSCYLEIGETEENDYFPSRDYDFFGFRTCPQCYGELDKEHDAYEVVDHIIEKYGDILGDYERSCLGGESLVNYCPKCGHFFSGSQYTTMLHKIVWKKK